jgi:hypothetical protein
MSSVVFSVGITYFPSSDYSSRCESRAERLCHGLLLRFILEGIAKTSLGCLVSVRTIGRFTLHWIDCLFEIELVSDLV